MGIVKKILIGTGITAVLAGAATYAVRLSRTSREIVIVPSAMLHKFSLGGLTLRVDVKIKNPTRSKLMIKYPFVKINYKNATIGSSQAVNRDLEIPAFGEVVISEIMIDIPLMGIFSLAGDLIKSLQGGEAIKVEVRTLTQINLRWRKLPVEQKQEITLKK
jgi:hypothetical protein